MMQHQPPPHHHLTTISEGGAAETSHQQPRQSLRLAAAPTAALLQAEQPRRHTLQQPTAMADGAVQRRRSRRTSSIRSSEQERTGRTAGGVAGAQLENSYRLGPAQLFPFEKAQALIKDRLAKQLKGYAYNAQSAKIIATNMAQEIKNQIKQKLLGGPNSRYKLVVLVTVTEAATPIGEFASRTLCHTGAGSVDGCVKAEFRGSQSAAWAAVFAFYCE